MTSDFGRFTSDRRGLGQTSWETEDDWSVGVAEGVDISGDQLVARPLMSPENAPAVGELAAHYDASKLATASPWIAEVGPDLSAVGDPSVVADEKNGHNVVRYDGTDDAHEGVLGSERSPPYHFFCAFRLRDLDATSSYNEYVLSTASSGGGHGFATNQYGSSWRMWTSGGNINAGTPDTSWHIASALFNGQDSMLRIDGVDVVSGELGEDPWSDIAIGYFGGTEGSWSAVDVGEILGYSTDKTASQEDIESYLNTKWGVY